MNKTYLGPNSSFYLLYYTYFLVLSWKMISHKKKMNVRNLERLLMCCYTCVVITIKYITTWNLNAKIKYWCMNQHNIMVFCFVILYMCHINIIYTIYNRTYNGFRLFFSRKVNWIRKLHFIKKSFFISLDNKISEYE